MPDINIIIDTIKNAINASTGNEDYMVGLRNGMRWCLSALTDKEPEYESIPSAESKQRNAKVFQGIVVEYPSIWIYPEYEGKPYFSIKYTENGQEFIGYGTYKPEVLSKYLKEYFILPAESGWIPCSEPPTENDSYFVWMPFAPKGHHITVAEWYGSYWNIKTPITAWMPIPESWKKYEEK